MWSLCIGRLLLGWMPHCDVGDMPNGSTQEKTDFPFPSRDLHIKGIYINCI